MLSCGVFVFQKVSVEAGGSWAVTLADYIRNNDQSLGDDSTKVLAVLQDEVTPCESFDELCDVVGQCT